MPIKKPEIPQTSIKEEIKKLEDKIPFDVMRILGLRPKPLEEKYKKYASLNRRTLATTIDALLVTVLTMPITDGLNTPTPEQVEQAQLDPNTAGVKLLYLLLDSGIIENLIIQMLALLIMSVVCWKIWSATPGKMLFGMKVVDMRTNEQISTKQSIIRAFGYIISCLPLFIGIFWIAFNKQRQGWHDKMAGTAVIVTSKLEKELRKEQATKETAKPIV